MPKRRDKGIYEYMIKDQFNLFAEHQEAIHLFQKLSEREANTPWSFLPILSLIGPSGYRKSAFIKHLYFHYCNAPFLPHISLDFERRNAPHDLLSILGTLRQSLGRQRDEKGHALAFPRFDIVYSRLKRSESSEEKERDDGEELFGEFDELIGLAGNVHAALGFVLFILKYIARIPPLRSFLHWLAERAYQRTRRQPQWRWYQDQVTKFKEFNLAQSDDVSKIHRRLNEMCTMGGPERQFLINQILPKAFLADLRYGASDNESSMLKDGPPYVVIFLDSFEVLLRNAEPVARQLLEILALNEYRKRGDSDPLLLIVASEERLPDMSRRQLNSHFAPDQNVTEGNREDRAKVLYEHWVKQLPPEGNRQALSLRDIYLPLALPTLTLDAARNYLLRQYNETDIFTNKALVEDIYRVTQGYPIFLERVATVLSASIQNPASGIQNITDLFATERGEQIVDRLLTLHCKKIEERAFMLSAVPQGLTRDLLNLVLQRVHFTSIDTNILNTEWRRYRHLPFLLASGDKEHVTFLPGIRALFLKKLEIMSVDHDSDYVNMHQLLYDYFNQRIEKSLNEKGIREKQDVLERSYHALALGDYYPVIQLAIFAQQHEPDLWADLLKVIARSPTAKLPSDKVKQQASLALYQAQQQTQTSRVVPEVIRAIVLYTWLLANPGSERKSVSSLWYELGLAYRCLQAVDPRFRNDRTTCCHRRADELLDPAIPVTQPLSSSPPTKPLPKNQQGTRHLIGGIYRTVSANRSIQIILGIVLTGAVLLSLFIPILSFHPPILLKAANPFDLSLAQLRPDASNQWIGATSEAAGREFVGLSDGSIPFDYMRPDGLLKIQAARQLYQGHVLSRQGDIAGARTSWQSARATLQQAIQGDVNDAEALIYQENIQEYLSSKACAVLVVATRIIEDSSEGVNDGRDNLQGAYLAQKQYNENHLGVPVCLYIANLGSNPGYELVVAQQLVHAAKARKDVIKGLIGWPGLLDSPTSLAAVHLLAGANLPIISPDNYDDAQFVSNVFHVSPSRQSQGSQAAFYAARSLQKKRVLILTDPADPYSRDLTESFKQRFEEEGGQVVSMLVYITGQISASALASEFHHALATSRPDFVYFTGGIEEGRVLLERLSEDGSSLLLLGSEQLYPFLGFSTNVRSDFAHLAFTSAAYADALVTTAMKANYALDFDPRDPDHVREYGYSRPDSEAILSYDAMETLITAYANAQGLQSMQQALSSIHISGASRQQIAFTPLQELRNQQLFMIQVNQREQIDFPTI